MARDICSFYRWHTQNGEWLKSLLFRGVENCLLVDPRPAIEARGSKYCNAGQEYSKRFQQFSDTWMLLNEYPRIYAFGSLTLLCIVIIPQLAFAFNEQISGWFSVEDTDT